MKTHVRILIPTLILLLGSSSYAYSHGGGEGGGYHNGGGGGGGYHNGGGYNNGGYHTNNGYNGNHYHNNNVWYGGGVNVDTDNVWYDDGVNDDDATNVVIGVPETGYYDPSCQNIQTCNSEGECVTQQVCDSE